jgi:hypothetical protein
MTAALLDVSAIWTCLENIVASDTVQSQVADCQAVLASTEGVDRASTASPSAPVQSYTTLLQGSRLVRTAFFDAPFLVATLTVIKNYALAGDAAHGAIFVHYTVRPHSAFHQPVAHLRSAASPFKPQLDDLELAVVEYFVLQGNLASTQGTYMTVVI